MYIDDLLWKILFSMMTDLKYPLYKLKLFKDRYFMKQIN